MHHKPNKINKLKILSVEIILCFLIIVTAPASSFSQTEKKIDSLKTLLPEASKSKRLEILYQLCVLNILNQPKKTIEYANQMLEEAEEIDSLTYISSAYTFLGEAYFYQGNKLRSLDYFNKELKLHRKHKNEEGIAKTFNNLGIIYSNLEQYEKALESYKKCLDYHSARNDTASMKNLFNNIGVLYFKVGNYPKALNYYNKSLEIERHSKEAEGMATSLLNIGHVYGKMGKLKQAEKLIDRSIQISDSFSLAVTKEYALKALYEIYENANQHKKALDYFKEYEKLKSERVNEETNNRIAELQVKYETAKNEKKIALLNKQKNQQQLIIYFFIGALGIVIVFGFLLYRQNRKKKKANDELRERNSEILQQKEEIESQRDEIESQRDEIERQRNIAVKRKAQIELQKKDITDSIEYAKHIQDALLPDRLAFQKILENGFYYFLPRDIVSGDFYWAGKVNGKSVIAAADCTGHGVPGAFMSIIGITFLNEIINDEKEDNPGNILNKLRKKVIKTLVHSDKFDETKDGMDIAVCSIDWDNKILHFAGAYNHLYLYRDDKLKVVKGNNMPIGLSPKPIHKFTTQEIQLQKEDMVYLFTDGYPDQFGGTENKKLKICGFKEILNNIRHEDIHFQKKLLHQSFLSWRNGCEQIDDVLVIGFKI